MPLFNDPQTHSLPFYSQINLPFKFTLLLISSFQSSFSKDAFEFPFQKAITKVVNTSAAASKKGDKR